MRGKTSKAYRKLMARYAASFGFREPYQVLVDPTIVEDAMKFKMDLVESLKRTLQGGVKPMITQCCIRHLYTTDNQPLITLAKSYERRRCNHSIDEPALSPLDCLLSVVIAAPNSTTPNKNRYVVATDDREIREAFRRYPGVPGIHIQRSVMVLDQMADVSVGFREREEKGKMRIGLKEKEGGGGRGLKRKRGDNDDDDDDNVESGEGKARGVVNSDNKQDSKTGVSNTISRKKKKDYSSRKKNPNPLSVMKKKKKPLIQSLASKGGMTASQMKNNSNNTRPSTTDSGTLVVVGTD